MPYPERCCEDPDSPRRLVIKSESDVDLSRCVHWPAIQHRWPIEPLLDRIDRRLDQHLVSADQLQILDLSILANTRCEFHRSFDSQRPCERRINGSDFLQQLGLLQIASNRWGNT